MAITTTAEENYLKAIFKIAEKENKAASTNKLAEVLGTSPASITDMIKKMSEKKLVNYTKYYGVTLSPKGSKIATNLIRKHRLWELFLVEKLRFPWHQVHAIAEELEHIKSDELIARLDAFLNYPKFDPHGDAIPNSEGKFTIRSQTPLSNVRKGQKYILVGLKESNDEFLKFLYNQGIKIGSIITLLEISDYDNTAKIILDGRNEILLGGSATQNLLVRNE